MGATQRSESSSSDDEEEAPQSATTPIRPCVESIISNVTEPSIGKLINDDVGSIMVSLSASTDMQSAGGSIDFEEIDDEDQATPASNGRDNPFVNWRTNLRPYEHNVVDMVVNGKMVSRRFGPRCSNAHNHAMFSKKKGALIELDEHLKPNPVATLF
jgi:hypothetical protein